MWLDIDDDDRTYSYEKMNESLVAKNWLRKYFNFNFLKEIDKSKWEYWCKSYSFVN